MNERSTVLLKAVFQNLSGQDKHHRIRQCRWYPNQNLNSRSPEQCDDVLHIFLISKTLFITSQIFAYYFNHTLYDTRNKTPVINVLSSLCCVCTPTRHPAITVEKRGKRISQSCGWDSTCIVHSYRTGMWALHTVALYTEYVTKAWLSKRQKHGLWKEGWLTSCLADRASQYISIMKQTSCTFHSVYWESIKRLYMFRALLGHPQEVLQIRHLVYYVRIMSAGCGTL
jgi:hypothetical protein